MHTWFGHKFKHVKPSDKCFLQVRCLLTDVAVLISFIQNYEVQRLIAVEVKWLKGVEQKISHVLIHVSPQNTSVEIIQDSSTIYHLQTIDINLYKAPDLETLSSNLTVSCCLCRATKQTRISLNSRHQIVRISVGFCSRRSGMVPRGRKSFNGMGVTPITSDFP